MSNRPQPPPEVLAFLRSGQQLRYDAAASDVGAIVLKSAEALAPTMIIVPTGCQEIECEDPYQDIEGHYEAEVLDLVADSEEYNPEGLLCWIPALKQFGTVDGEHGTVRTFRDASWQKIVANPAEFLDSQWRGGGEHSQIELPWLCFSFRLSDGDTAFPPYPRSCPAHGAPVEPGHVERPPLFDVLRRRELGQWVERYVSEFPCSGVPIDELQLLHCVDCRNAELRWCEAIADSIVPIPTQVNGHGWTQCPFCGVRFSVKSQAHFRDGIHLSCGQKLRI